MRAEPTTLELAMRLAGTTILGLLVSAVPAAAQLSLEARLGGAHDAIGYGDSDPEGQLSAAGAFRTEYGFADGRAQLAYSLDAATYAGPGDWSTLLHDLVGLYRIDLSGSGNARFLLAAEAVRRDNGDAWSAAGYRALGGHATFEVKPAEVASLRLGYRIDGRDFPDAPELNQLEHDGFLSGRLNLPTRTTLIGEVRVGTKSYSGEIIPVEGSPTTAPSSSGRGQGRSGMRPSFRPADVAWVQDSDRAARVAWLVRVAQSLTNRTGLSFQYAGRHASGEVPPALVTTPPHFQDDGVYDDPYASDAQALGATLKQVFVGKGVARGWVEWRRKDYRANLALDETGAPLPDGALRQDRALRIGADWSLPLFPSRTGSLALDLDLAYVLVRQQSNDAFYDYTSHAFWLAFSIAY
jgi:hypothetical protein